MNLSRLAIGFLMVVPTVLFIAAAESATEPAPANDASAQKPAAAKAAPAAEQPAPPANALPTNAPLRTQLPAVSLPGSEGGDAAATRAILDAIRADPGMAGADVSVNTENGVVSLTGVVRNREQAAIASAYANRQMGVLRVDNALTIPAQ
jgi:hypothetical protein